MTYYWVKEGKENGASNFKLFTHIINPDKVRLPITGALPPSLPPKIS
jgi:hypothetical protein